MNRDIYKAIAQKFGTPTYIYYPEKLQNNYLKIKNMLSQISDSNLIAYPIKANYNPQLILNLKKLNSFFEASSSDEIKFLSKLRISNDKIFFNGPIKGSQIPLTVKIQINSINELRRFLPYRECLVRIKVGKSRFGILQEDLIRIENRENVIGFHFHAPCDSYFNSNGYINNYLSSIISFLKFMKQEITHFPNIKYLNIGGGLGIISNQKDNNKWFNAIFEVWNELINYFSSQLGRIILIAEPGTSLVYNTMDLLTKVRLIVLRDGVREICLDCGLNDLGMPTNEFDYRILDKKDALISEKQVWFGPTCMEDDKPQIKMASTKISENDLLLIKKCGAYNFNFSVSFIQNKPPIIQIQGDKFKVVLEKEKYFGILSRVNESLSF